MTSQNIRISLPGAGGRMGGMLVGEIAKADDVVIFLGAGNITQFSDTIISKINNLEVNND